MYCYQCKKAIEDDSVVFFNCPDYQYKSITGFDLIYSFLKSNSGILTARKIKNVGSRVLHATCINEYASYFLPQLQDRKVKITNSRKFYFKLEAQSFYNLFYEQEKYDDNIFEPKILKNFEDFFACILASKTTFNQIFDKALNFLLFKIKDKSLKAQKKLFNNALGSYQFSNTDDYQFYKFLRVFFYSKPEILVLFFEKFYFKNFSGNSMEIFAQNLRFIDTVTFKSIDSLAQAKILLLALPKLRESPYNASYFKFLKQIIAIVHNKSITKNEAQNELIMQLKIRSII